MIRIEKRIREEVEVQLGRADGLKKQSTTVSLSGLQEGEDCEVTTYWVANVLRVDIKLPKEKEPA